ncbi:MAG TPA: hypothetical protein DCO89_03080 [Clostridiales bacterium]|nr:hypothetical protein [Clostridiales bacterium]
MCMISIICFIIVVFGSMNWLSIGFFQYDLVAGLFGYQGSIFSRIIYIVVGIAAIYLIYVIIKNKGRLTVNKLKKQEQPIVDQITKKDEDKLEKDKKIAKEMKLKEDIKEEIKKEITNSNSDLKHSAETDTDKESDNRIEN